MDLAQKPVYKLDLAAGTSVVNLTTPLVEGDDRAQTFTLELTDKGAPANLDGYSVTAYFGRGKTAEAEADTIPLSGTVSGNVATITLTESCYSRSCYFSMPIRLSNGATGQKRTYLIVRGTVVKSVDGTIIDPDGSVPSLDDLFAQIAVMERSRQAAEEATEEALAAAARADEAREGIQGDLATLSEDIGELTVQQFDYAVTSKMGIRPNGAVEDFSTAYNAYQYKVTDYIDVSGKKRIVVCANADYGNLLYAFYDANKTYISGRAAPVDTTLVNEDVAVPDGAKYVVVGTEWRPARLFVGYYVSARETLVSPKTANGKWLLLGDSVTDNRNDTTPMRYYEYIAHPSCELVNDAVSGSGYIRNNGAATNNILSKVEALTGNEGYDIISVFAGINDSGYVDDAEGNPLGALGDTSPTTYYGAIYTVFSTLQEKYPTAYIIAITPTVTSYRHSANNKIDQLSQAVREVCGWLKIPVADVNRDCPLKPWIAANQAAYYAPDDGAHPNQGGHKLIANVVRRVFDFK